MGRQAGTPSVSKYGMHLSKTGGWIHHQGEQPGFNTIGAYVPELDATVVVLCNTSIPKHGLSPAVSLLLVVGEILAPEYTPSVGLP